MNKMCPHRQSLGVHQWVRAKLRMAMMPERLGLLTKKKKKKFPRLFVFISCSCTIQSLDGSERQKPSLFTFSHLTDIFVHP